MTSTKSATKSVHFAEMPEPPRKRSALSIAISRFRDRRTSQRLASDEVEYWMMAEEDARKEIRKTRMCDRTVFEYGFGERKNIG
jgi:hypothetical protein